MYRDREVERVKSLIFWFLGSLWDLLMLSEPALTELSTNRAAVKQLWADSEQGDFRVCLWARRTAWAGLQEVLSLEAGILGSHTQSVEVARGPRV